MQSAPRRYSPHERTQLQLPLHHQLPHLPTIMMSLPRSPMTLAGVLYCCPSASPPADSCTPGVIWMSPGGVGPQLQLEGDTAAEYGRQVHQASVPTMPYLAQSLFNKLLPWWLRWTAGRTKGMHFTMRNSTASLGSCKPSSTGAVPEPMQGRLLQRPNVYLASRTVYPELYISYLY